MRLFCSVCIFIIALSSAVAGDLNQSTAKIRIYKNDLEKIYTVFFADTTAHTVTLSIQNEDKEVILTEEFQGKGFSKKFSLAKLKNGAYDFIISYEDVFYSETVLLRSEKDILAENFRLTQKYPDLEITIKPVDLSPINIHVYSMEDKLLKVFYWEPNENLLTKVIDISQFEGYEVKVEIIQSEEQKLEELVLLY